VSQAVGCACVCAHAGAASVWCVASTVVNSSAIWMTLLIDAVSAERSGPARKRRLSQAFECAHACGSKRDVRARAPQGAGPCSGHDLVSCVRFRLVLALHVLQSLNHSAHSRSPDAARARLPQPHQSPSSAAACAAFVIWGLWLQLGPGALQGAAGSAGASADQQTRITIRGAGERVCKGQIWRQWTLERLAGR
jgi:hypothetical protein